MSDRKRIEIIRPEPPRPNRQLSAKALRFDLDKLETWVKTLLTRQGGGIPAIVKSKVSNNKYLVDLYANGIYLEDGVTLADPTKVDAECYQLQIDNTETIPTGTWAIATKVADGRYYMQVPVWLDG